MKDELKFRPLNREDYETICKWWKWWRWPVIPREMLPDEGKSGFIVEKNNVPIVSAFLFITNSKGAKLEWVVSNPKTIPMISFLLISFLANIPKP